MLVIAAHQVWLSQTQALSPWLGGGFGMFSSLDSPDRRHLHVFAYNDSIRKELLLPADMQESNQRVQGLPSSNAVSDFDQEVRLMFDIDPSWTLEIQVWGTLYDHKTLMPRGVLIKTVTVGEVDSIDS
jgi:hypothetical protein